MWLLIILILNRFMKHIFCKSSPAYTSKIFIDSIIFFFVIEWEIWYSWVENLESFRVGNLLITNTLVTIQYTSLFLNVAIALPKTCHPSEIWRSVSAKNERDWKKQGIWMETPNSKITHYVKSSWKNGVGHHLERS